MNQIEFDASRDSIYLTLRGRPALDDKLRLIDACDQLDVPMSLTATVAGGVNDQVIRDVADLLFRHRRR